MITIFDVAVGSIGIISMTVSRVYQRRSISAFRYDRQKVGERYDVYSLFGFAVAVICVVTLMLTGVA